VETATADISLGGGDAGILTGGVFALPPGGYVLNSISCRDIGNKPLAHRTPLLPDHVSVASDY
jgi:hypothetical protein